MSEKFLDQGDDSVDPRVQIELERLNSATDEINRLEVDLDEARNQFRQLLQESTSRIDSCAKKLGSCIIKVRPYYDARIKAKEALQETQKAAVNFERANSAHAAAKEMVYLAEEGLKAEGRTFDHAWQEMLNHATMRVNDSESERTLAEAEHKRTSQNYQLAEIRVRTLQKELKRAITKSRPYFELKIHYTQLLEKQKLKVKNLEKQVTEVKLSYAQTLKNLERISDEIHKTRQRNKHSTTFEEGKLSGNPLAESDSSNGFSFLYNLNKTKSGCAKTIMRSESVESRCRIKDVGMVSEAASPNSENDSSLTGPPDTESEDEVFKFPQNPNCFGTVNPNIPVFDSKTSAGSLSQNSTLEDLGFVVNSDSKPSLSKELIFEGVGICSFPAQTELNFNFEEGYKTKENIAEGSDWTEIKLSSPEEEIFSTVKIVHPGKSVNELEENFDIPYAPLSELEEDLPKASHLDESPNEKKTELIVSDCSEKNGLNGMLCGLGSRSAKKELNDSEEHNSTSLKGTPKKLNLRRQSLDVLWNKTAGEKVKEIFSQSIMKLNIGSLAERRSIDSRMGEGNEFNEDESSINSTRGNDNTYESNLTRQFGINFFNRKNSKAEDDFIQIISVEDKKSNNSQESISTQIGGFITRKERFSFKKVPSPLEKTLNYLNADEESNSDSESLASSDMLTDEQLSSLVLDRDLAEIYQDII